MRIADLARFRSVSEQPKGFVDKPRRFPEEVGSVTRAAVGRYLFPVAFKGISF